MDSSKSKLVSVIIWVVVLIFVATLGFFVFQTKNFWSTWFEVKQQKIELRDEKSVDSLLNVISLQDSILNNHEEFYGQKYNKTIDSLNDIINAQSVTIADNKRAIKQYREVIDNQNKLINK